MGHAIGGHALGDVRAKALYNSPRMFFRDLRATMDMIGTCKRRVLEELAGKNVMQNNAKYECTAAREARSQHGATNDRT